MSNKYYDSISLDIDTLEVRLQDNKGCYSLSRLIKVDREIAEKIMWCFQHDLINEEESKQLQRKLRNAFKAYF